ncbi:hypothetical protein BcDW1_6338 [Botrytis cinerea BcDW1]|uniref:Uncharacterized protein n=1 Tax=Botryotinia fuckeliana (strain BcDW1) TaxID=1290391 RepID=M7TUY9_BOTF1|nr:hypothetical protein BcDW1_6338 [Botrytis cinerea BcDW1]
MSTSFDQVDVGASALDECLGIQFEMPRSPHVTLGTQFEIERRGADFDLRDLIKYRPHDVAHNDDSERRALINDEPSDPAAVVFEVSQDLLHVEFGSMRILLREIYYSELQYRRFAYVPYYLLFVYGFAWAQTLLADINEETGILGNDMYNLRSSRRISGVSKIVWRMTLNAALYSGRNYLRPALLAGLGISGLWSVYRAWRLGTIIWCRYSLDALVKKFEAGQLDERDDRALEGLKWNMLWYINIMFC